MILVSLYFLLIFATGGEFLEVLIPEKFPCAARITGNSSKNVVCVCNATYCDRIEPAENHTLGGKFLIYRSSEAGDRLRKYYGAFLGAGDEKADITIQIDAKSTYQEIIGFGGAFSDSTGLNLNSLDVAVQDQILRAYFGPDGLDYSLARVPIGSTDFSTHEYSLDEVQNDTDLTMFKLSNEDLQMKIPFIRCALALSPNLKLFASPWSPPGWMKTNQKMHNGGSLLPTSQIHQSYANYLTQFFTEYAKNHVEFWGMTVQNEPRTSGMTSWTWQGLNLTREMERDFLRDYLGPTLRAENVTRDLKIMVLDDVRTDVVEEADTIFNDPIASSFADGIAVHWYDDAFTSISLYDTTHKNHPSKFLLATEACLGFEDGEGPKLGNWSRAEELAWSQIEYLEHWVSGWVDWNLVLDEKGGPNWVNNMVDVGIVVNQTAQEFYKQPIFYSMGHFSKFLPPASLRIHHEKISDSTENQENPKVTCAILPRSARRTCVILNREPREINAKLVDIQENREFLVKLAPNSIQTVIWDGGK
ncbi:unnamed protein product [Caenorhabditis angaria]|uniref:Glucosylceramidase n=1 Tax=Caenorhabditis angaria TaxID=860376 RepID=A0A9P1IKZ3_9PELO|nr:unnamed protein product [Caenorhabditis angaria]